MNKILPYIVIAILLGTVTMVVPYTLLGSNDMAEENTLGYTSSTKQEKPDSQNRYSVEGGDLENGDAAPSVPEPEPCGFEATGSDLIIESLSTLSPIGLITIPSFLIALGAFIYLKKRM
jgi:hypothetical protein